MSTQTELTNRFAEILIAASNATNSIDATTALKETKKMVASNVKFHT